MCGIVLDYFGYVQDKTQMHVHIWVVRALNSEVIMSRVIDDWQNVRETRSGPNNS